MRKNAPQNSDLPFEQRLSMTDRSIKRIVSKIPKPHQHLKRNALWSKWIRLHVLGAEL